MNDKQPCMWFAKCKNEAAGTIPHPILGDVPACERCIKWDADMTAPF